MEAIKIRNIIIAILVVVLLVVIGLLVFEMRQPDTLTAYVDSLQEQQDLIGEACSDLTTEEGRETCQDALVEVQAVVDDIGGEEEEVGEQE